MVSFSIAYRCGVDRFARDARAAGFDAVIFPDLPPPEAAGVCETIRAANLDTVLLVAPTTSPARRAEIAKLCSGFIYYLSTSGVTGERDQLPPDLLDNVRALKQLSDTPVCVGFGIHRREQVAQLRGVADGAIVGSAIVRRMKANVASAPRAVADYCRDLLDAPPATT
jgi:tryptophan synthase alpha chain